MILHGSQRWLAVATILTLGLSACTEEAMSTAAPSSTVAIAATVSETPTTSSTPAFDLDQFLSSKLGGAFSESEETIGVVLMVPPRAEAEVDVMIGELAELEGTTHLSPEALASAADRFAASRAMRLLEGDWAGIGLIPRFADTPVADWVSALLTIPDVRAAQVEFVPRSIRIPDGWREVADLPFRLESGAIVEGLPSGMLVLQSDSTMLIDSDGSFAAGGAPPMSISAECCGPADSLPAGDVVVLVAEGSTKTWLLEPGTLAWREATPRPNPGYVLGSAVIGGELFVVTAAPRIGDAVSTMAALDLDTGVWRQLDAVPSPISVGGVTSDGRWLIVAGTRQDGNNSVIGDRNPVAFQYTLSEGWREHSSIPVDGQSSTVVWADGAGLLAWNYDLESALLDQSGIWQGMGNVPMRSSECHPESIQTRIGVFGFCGGIALFDKTETWSEVSSPIDTRFGVVDDAVLGLVSSSRERTKLIAFPLDR